MQVFFIFLFLFVFSCEADRRWSVTIVLWFVLVPPFGPSLWSLLHRHVTSLGNASAISTPTMTHPFYFCFLYASHVIFHCMFFSVTLKILNTCRSLCPLDCMVAVADVGLLCGETLCFQAFTKLGLGFSIGSESGLGVELIGHGGGGYHGLEASCALGHILLRMEENHVDLRHVEQPQGHRGAQTHRDGQSGCLDVHLFCGLWSAKEDWDEC